ncbi:MAG: recombinase family protein [Pseudomonadota bacterium]
MVFVRVSALRDSPNEVNETRGKQRVRRLPGKASTRKSDLIGKDRFRPAQMSHPRRLGYIRVSTKSQMPDRQVEALRAECDELHIEHVSAVAGERPAFDAVLASLTAGDTFVVMDLDRAFRSSVDAILTAEHLRQRSVTFRILSMAIDTSTPEGELYYTMIAGFAQFERRIISRRTREGLDAARARGVTLGRRPKLSEAEVLMAYRRLTTRACKDVASDFGVSRITLQRNFRRLGLRYPVCTKQAEKEPPHV